MAVLAVQGTLAWISHFPAPRRFFGDEIVEHWPGATRLAAGYRWDPDPLRPPLYHRFLAGILVVGKGSILWVEVVQSVMLLGVALLLCDLTRELTHSQVAGAVAGWLVLVYPPLVAFAHYLWPEVIHLLLFLAALWILVRRAQRPVWLAMAGLLLGLALLAKSLLGPFLPVLLLPLALAGTLRERALRVALVVIGIAGAISPVVCSNWKRSTGVLIADSSAFNLWVGLNERSRVNFVDRVVGPEWRIYRQSAPSFPERNEILRRKIRGLVAERGVLALLGRQLGRQYFRLFDKDSYLTVQLPGGPVAADGNGYRDPPALIAGGLRWSSYVLYAAVLVATAVGIGVCPHRGRRWLLVGLAFVAYNLALFLLLHVKSRYRIQLLPLLFLYTGCAVAWVTEKLGLSPGGAVGWRPRIPAWSWPAAALLLFLAFGRTLFE